VSLAPNVDNRTRVAGCLHCNAAFQGRVIRVTRSTTVFSVIRVAISHLHKSQGHYQQRIPADMVKSRNDEVSGLIGINQLPHPFIEETGLALSQNLP